MNLKGYKMDGLGNDFLIIDQRNNPINLSEDQIRHLADRNNIGFDQLIYIHSGKGAIPDIHFFNSDGGETSACGNGSRCISYLLMKENNTDKISIQTKSGILHSSLSGPQNITIDMGEPIFQWNKIPIAKDENIKNITINVPGHGSFSGYALSVGNPHFIIFQEISKDELKIIGPLIENHQFFPEKCNVTFAKVVDQENIKVNVWERGAGLTLACGTGACATLVACADKQLTNRSADIHFSTGSLKIEWKPNNKIYMSGPVSNIQAIEIEI